MLLRRIILFQVQMASAISSNSSIKNYACFTKYDKKLKCIGIILTFLIYLFHQSLIKLFITDIGANLSGFH